MKFRPLEDRVLLKQLEAEEVSKGGIVIPDTVKEKPQEGKIIAIGGGKTSTEGRVIPINLSVGDKVLYGKYSGTEVVIDGEEYVLVSSSDILGVI